MNREQTVASGLALFSIIYLIASWRLPRFPFGSMVVDAHIFPLSLGVLLLVLSAILYVQSAPKGKDAKGLLDGVDRRLLGLLILATFIYALVLGTLGYIIATTLFLGVDMWLLGRRKWTSLLSTAVGFSFITYLIFVYVLSVPLAQGILPF